MYEKLKFQVKEPFIELVFERLTKWKNKLNIIIET